MARAKGSIRGAFIGLQVGMRLVQGKRKRAIGADAQASLDRNMKQIITMTVIGASLASCAVLSDKFDVTLVDT